MFLSPFSLFISLSFLPLPFTFFYLSTLFYRSILLLYTLLHYCSFLLLSFLPPLPLLPLFFIFTPFPLPSSPAFSFSLLFPHLHAMVLQFIFSPPSPHTSSVFISTLFSSFPYSCFLFRFSQSHGTVLRPIRTHTIPSLPLFFFSTFLSPLISKVLSSFP